MAYVNFGSGVSRDLSAAYDIASYDELFWFYDAEKKDGYGSSGSGTSLKIPGGADGKGITGEVGPFSQGAWSFTLYAYAEGSVTVSGEEEKTYTIKADQTPVYKSGAIAVDLKRGEHKTVPVSVTPQGENGTLKFDAYFEWKDSKGGKDPVDVVVDIAGEKYTGRTIIDKTYSEDDSCYRLDDTISLNKVENNPNAIPAGYYTVTVSVYPDVTAAAESETRDYSGREPFVRQTLGLRVYGNATTTIKGIKGDLVEGVDSYITFDVANTNMTIFQGATSVDVDIAPSGVSGEKTTVNLEAAKNIPDNATLFLDVAVTSASAAADSIKITGTDTEGKTAVAGIDITLNAVTTNGIETSQSQISDLGGEVEVTTYITKGLSSVTVAYVNEKGELVEGKQPDSTSVSYTPSDGKLVFKTNHFSRFIALSTFDGADKGFASGAGTADFPYIIETTEQFLKIADIASEMYPGSKYYYFSIENDIDVTNVDAVKPILYFRGELDFNGHTFSGITKDKLLAGSTTGEESSALIDIFLYGAIRDLAYSPNDVVALAAIAPNVYNGNMLFENISVGSETDRKNFKVESGNEGFFLNHAYAENTGYLTFRNCTNYYGIESTDYIGVFVGGGSGVSKLVFEDCVNYGTFYADKIGFLIGNSYLSKSTDVIIAKNCINEGYLYGTTMANEVCANSKDASKFTLDDQSTGNDFKNITLLDKPSAEITIGSDGLISVTGLSAETYPYYEIYANAYSTTYKIGDSDRTSTGTLLVNVSTGILETSGVEDLKMRKLNFYDISGMSNLTEKESLYNNRVVEVEGTDYFGLDLSKISLVPGTGAYFPSGSRNASYRLFVYDSSKTLKGALTF